MSYRLKISLLLLTSVNLLAHSATIGAAPTDEKLAQQAVLKILKNPQSIKWGQFSLAGEKAACLTIYAKSSLTGLVGSQEAFLTRSESGWHALYIADIPSGHKGCIEEMAKR